MKRIFAVTRARGGDYDSTLPLEAQPEWKSHAEFMDALHAEGFVLLAGPLEGTQNVLLIIRAENADEINSRLADDSWTRNGFLRTVEISPWTLRIGSLG
jgi:uncharacterized protein YciI